MPFIIEHEWNSSEVGDTEPSSNISTILPLHPTSLIHLHLVSDSHALLAFCTDEYWPIVEPPQKLFSWFSYLPFEIKVEIEMTKNLVYYCPTLCEIYRVSTRNLPQTPQVFSQWTTNNGLEHHPISFHILQVYLSAVSEQPDYDWKILQNSACYIG